LFRETQARSVAKSLSWRLLGTVATALLVFIFSRRVVLSIAVGTAEFFAKLGLYWLHERFWDRLSYGRRQVEPAVVWFTGLPGSGKSTVADSVAEALRSRGLKVERLDGDSVRQLFPQTGFTRGERDEHLRRVGFLASRMEKQGVFVVASFVSPYEDSRRFVRGLCSNFVEVYVATPLEECERRDPKGLYARARRGEIANFTGVNDPYEAPANAEVVVDTTNARVEQLRDRVLSAIRGA
jgi:adenylylsulfate kinase